MSTLAVKAAMIPGGGNRPTGGAEHRRGARQFLLIATIQLAECAPLIVFELHIDPELCPEIGNGDADLGHVRRARQCGIGKIKIKSVRLTSLG